MWYLVMKMASGSLLMSFYLIEGIAQSIIVILV